MGIFGKDVTSLQSQRFVALIWAKEQDEDQGGPCLALEGSATYEAQV